MGRSKLHYIKHTDTRKDNHGHNNMTASEQTEVRHRKLDTGNEDFRFGFFLNVFINHAITSLEYTVFILLFILKLSDRFSRNLIADFFVTVNITLPLFTILQYVRTTRRKHELLKSVRH